MSEHHEHTEFLKHCLRYDDGPERHAMMEKLTRLQRELRTVKRATWLMVILIAAAGASLFYPALLIQNFPYSVQRFIMNFVLALFVSLSICLVTFIVMELFLRRRLYRQRAACRQFLRQLLAARFDTAQQIKSGIAAVN